MSQTLLLQKLARFLELTNRKKTLILQKDLRKNGYCYGLSICHASMKLIGKLDWWEAALIKIANWDGHSKSLKQKARLPNAIDPDETLEHVIERVLNYAVFNHVHDDHKSYENIKMDGVSQPAFLQARRGYFEILTPDDKIEVIKNRKCVAGFFDARQLVDLLDEKTIAGSICLIHSTLHTISVSYQKPDWIIYDPNYDHNIKSGTVIHKKFKTKEDLVGEILEIQGHSLAIECASFKHAKEIPFPKYEQIIKNSALRLFQEFGFHLIVTEIPERVPELIERVKKVKHGAQLIACALLESDEVEWAGIHKLAYYAPEQLLAVLEFVLECKGGYDVIAEAIKLIEPEEGCSGFHIIVSKMPASLPQVLDYLACSAIGPDSLVTALITKTKEGVSGWDLVNQLAPDCKKLIEKIILNGADNIQSKTLVKLIAQIKQSDCKDGKCMRSDAKIHVFFKKNEDKFSSQLFMKKLVSIVEKENVAVPQIQHI